MSLNFGMYLVDQQAITSEQFTDAIRARLNDKVPLGQLALRRRKLSMSQVFDILRMQSGKPAPFGKLAMEAGYLSEPQLAELLYYQSEHETPLTRLLVQQGAITHDALDHHYREYQHIMEQQSSRPMINSALLGRTSPGADELSTI